MNVSAQYVTEHFEDVASAVDQGEIVEIARPNKPSLRLISVPVQPEKNATPRILGAGRGDLEPLPYEEWERIDREWKNDFASKFGDEA